MVQRFKKYKTVTGSTVILFEYSNTKNKLWIINVNIYNVLYMCLQFLVHTNSV